MVVGLLCDSFPPELDGVGMVVESYGRELVAQGETCFLIAPDSPLCDGRRFPYHLIRYHGLKVPQAPQYRTGIPAWDLQYLVDSMDIKPDILHAHSPFGAGVEALRLARVHDIPLVGTFHSKYYDDFYQATHSEMLAEAGVKVVVSFYNACNEVWTVNDATAQVLRDYGYKKDIRVMQNGTDLWYPTDEDRREASRAYGLGDAPVFLYVGQQNWKKNIRMSIEALALYKQKQPNFKMVLVGQGPHAGEIKALVREKGLEQHFVYTGQLTDRKRMMGLYARADLFMFPSLYDTAGLVVREAAASGTPSVLVRGSCAAECIREGENGFLCDNTPQDLCALLHRVTPDAAMRLRVGEAARNSIPVPWSGIIQDVRKRYAEIIRAYDAREIHMEDERFAGSSGLQYARETVRNTVGEVRESILENLHDKSELWQETRRTIQEKLEAERKAIRSLKKDE